MTALVVLCCAVAVITWHACGCGSAVEAVVKPTSVGLAWSVPVNDLAGLTFASTGKYLAAIDHKGTVSVFNLSGQKKYSALVPGADTISISPDAKYAMVYSRLDRKNTTCTFLDGSGNAFWNLRVNGAVWSADSCITEDGARFVIGTGTRRVYVVDIGAHRKYYKWRTVPGAVVSLALEPDGEDYILGTWQDTSVERRSIDSRRDWDLDADMSVLPYIEKLGTSGRLAVRYVPNNRSKDGTYEIVSAKGQVTAQGEIDASEKTRVLFDPAGKYVCISYTETIEHSGKSMMQKRTVLQDASGRKLWEKGSSFFQTDPMLVTSKGEVLLRDAKNSLFMTSGTGSLKQVLKLKAKPLRCALSNDGTACAISCSDGNLYLLKLSM